MNRNDVAEDKHSEASSFNPDELKVRDVVSEASHDSPNSFPAYSKLRIESPHQFESERDSHFRGDTSREWL